MATTETMFPDQSDFDYDYETLRTIGIILAVFMFVSGILIALSNWPVRQNCLYKRTNRKRL
uniref:FXYD domain-containing ion transport regulator n=1 Tax=Mola mola TaxID=94237 RepID=A0A3Q3VJ55_MOLML